MAIKIQGDTVIYDDKVFQVGSGTTLERPGTPAEGMIRYNTDLDTFEGYSNGSWGAIGGVAGFITKPSITTPTNNQTNFWGQIVSSAFSANSDTFYGTHTESEWQLATNSNFTTIVDSYSGSSNLTTWTPTEGYQVSTVFYTRVRYGSDNHWSEFSTGISFTTPNFFVNTPTLTVEGSPSSVPETPTLTTSAFSTNGGSGTHLNTDWRVLSSSDVVLWQSLADSTNKTSITVPAGILNTSTLYKFQVRYRDSAYGASAWTTVTATTVESFYDRAIDVDGLDQIITTQQSEWNSATSYAINAVVIVRKGPLRFIEYKSLVGSNLNNNPETSPTHWELVFDNNTTTAGYFGEVLGSSCVVDKGEWNSATAYSIGDMVVVAKVSPPKKQSDLEAYVAKTANTNKNPVTNPADWEQRNGLPTGTSLAQTLGIGNVSPEVLINNDSGWLKFVHKGKIKYVAKKPFMHTVSWDDIAKSEAVYGNRTIRIGSRLYRVSLLSGAEADPTTWTTISSANNNKGAGSEWNELIYRVHNDVPTSGTTINHGGAQIGSNWHNFSDADIVVGTGDGRFTWCRETLASNTSDRVTRGGDSLSYFNGFTSSATATGSGWRPCLTLISEPEADSTLYNAEASGVGPSVASLQYDPITDTGYYGEVAAANLYTGSGISTAVGLTAGTLQNDTEGWLKFYWHGQVLYVAKKTYRHSISWDSINSATAVYGVNLGSTGRKTVATGGNTYEVKLMMGAVKDPSPAPGGGRQWNELIYRVCTGTETGEIGSNWALLIPSTDLGINSGNGSYTWCREVYLPSTSNRVYRGLDSLSRFNVDTSSSTVTSGGWRPCLALVR